MKAVALILLCLASPLLGADAMPPKALPAVNLGQWVAGLAVVLAVLLGCVFLLRRFGNFSTIPVGRFRVLGAVSLGARERAVLLQAGGKQLVLGVAPGQVRTLCVLEGDDVIPADTGSRPPAVSFAERLHERMDRQPS